MIKNRLHFYVFLLLVFIKGPFFCLAQDSNRSKYPQGYFRNPLNIPISLSANFGELRPDHWHMGFDIRTNQKENYPVFAAAGGYVSHIGIRAQSFGRFMIISHPNGYSTLYAHLNSFYPELEKYVRGKQNEKESWTIELDFPVNQFKVKQGDTIALNGNTGGSQGPHLHFEIRDSKTGRCFNPMLFGFDIKDNVPPVVNHLAIYDRTISTYSQKPQMIPLKITDSGYYTKPLRIKTGFKKISFAIGAYDQVSGSRGANGIYGATLNFDQKPIEEFVLDNIDYDETDYVDAHIDRKYKNSGGPYLQHISKLPGYRGPVYHDIGGTGIINLDDSAVHFVKIKVFDTKENYAELFFEIQYSDSLVGKIKKELISKPWIPGAVNIFEEKDFEVFMPDNCLYDTVPLTYSVHNIFSPIAVSAQHQLSDPLYPINASFTVRIKPTVRIENNKKEKIVITREWKGERSVRKAVWQNDPNAIGWLTANFSDFGNFQAFVDLEAPKINPPAKDRLSNGKEIDTLNLSPLKRIVFTPSDNFGIRSFRAELDGKWLMFTNDKGKNYIYTFDEQCPYGVHTLKVRIEDIVGNVTEKTWWFKKYPYTPPPKKKSVKKGGTSKKK